jgi:peptidoglycan hydrolase CwlO-like protein
MAIKPERRAAMKQHADAGASGGNLGSENEKDLAKDVRELLDEVEALEDRRKKLEADNSDLRVKLQKAENELRLRD